MASAYSGAMPRIRMHVPVHTYARVDVNVCIAPCKRTPDLSGLLHLKVSMSACQCTIDLFCWNLQNEECPVPLVGLSLFLKLQGSH